MKRTVSLLLLLLIIGGLFLVADLVNQMNRTSSNDMEDANSYWIFDDIPAIKASSVAYLLDPDFTVTPENFADCINDYFSAPAMLYFGDYPTTRAIKDYKKASAFGAVFRDVPLVPISSEDCPDYEHCDEQYEFYNAIGNFELRLWQGETYIHFFGYDCDVNTPAYFPCLRVQGDLISKCKLVGESLKDDSMDGNGFEIPH